MSSNRPGEVRPRSRKFATEQAWTGFAMREDAARIIRRIRRPCALPHASSGVCWPWKRRHLGQVGLVVDQAGYFPENQKMGESVMNIFRIALPAIVLACGLAGPASAQQFAATLVRPARQIGGYLARDSRPAGLARSNRRSTSASRARAGWRRFVSTTVRSLS